MNVLPENTIFAVLAIFAGLVLLFILRSENIRGQIKKGVIFLLVVTGLGVGYYFLTGKSPATIPADINYFLNGPQAAPEEESHKYYRDPEKRYGDQLKE